MLIPLGTDVRRRRPTVITYWLIGINIAVMIAQEIHASADPDGAMALLDRLMLHPGADSFAWWQLITHAFLHAGLMHLLGNMLFLFVFGMAVEERLGRLGFLAFYLGGGVCAALVQMWASEPVATYMGMSIYAPMLGASGAVAAVTGAFLVYFPKTHVKVLLFFFLIGLYSIPSWWFIVFAIAHDFVLQGMYVDNVAHAAHLGGYAFGIGLSLTLLATHVVQRQPYDLFSIFRQAHRRRTFRELTQKQGREPWMGRVGARDRHRFSGGAASDEYATRRAAVSEAFGTGNTEEAADRYIALLEDFPDAVMNRDAQMQIANSLMARGRHEHAAAAYSRFLSRHGSDAEADSIRLLLALINARYLNDPVEAGRLLSEVRESNLDEHGRATYESLRKDLA
ncbi:MAG: rhomboid family intramembrane serine protease [Phycisphaerales bacterium]|nr:rhomboid family intramembrane serine protease [Phycisphaerales bacterium]